MPELHSSCYFEAPPYTMPNTHSGETLNSPVPYYHHLNNSSYHHLSHHISTTAPHHHHHPQVFYEDESERKASKEPHKNHISSTRVSTRISRKNASYSSKNNKVKREDDFDADEDEDEDEDEEDGHIPHVLAPTSAHSGGHHRSCLLWACKACKKKNVAVDRRKAATMRERRRLRKVKNAISFIFYIELDLMTECV